MKTLLPSYKWLPEFILFLMMTPLLFFNINNFHDWGDDFAQYLLQARVITGSLTNMPVSDVSGYGPTNKGLLFSLILTPFTFVDGMDIKGGKILVSLSLIFCGWMFFRLLKNNYSKAASLLITLFFVYNYHIIRLKDQVLPDLLFTGLVLAVLVLIRSKRRNAFLMALVLAGISTGIRSAGLALVLVMAILIATGSDSLYSKAKWKSFLFLFAPCVFVFLWEFIEGGTKPASAWYASVTISDISVNTIHHNFQTYLQATRLFFEQEMPMWMNTLLWYFMLAGLIAGAFMGLKSNRRPEVLFAGLYIFILLCYPYQREPLRFIVPLIPILLLMALDFYSFLAGKLRKNSNIVLLAIAVILAGSGIKTTTIELQKNQVYEPYSDESLAMIKFIIDEIPPNDTISFNKPYALALFTNRHCVPAVSFYKADWIVLSTSTVNSPGLQSLQPVNYVYQNKEYLIVPAK